MATLVAADDQFFQQQYDLKEQHYLTLKESKFLYLFKYWNFKWLDLNLKNSKLLVFPDKLHEWEIVLSLGELLREFLLQILRYIFEHSHNDFQELL